MKVLVTTPYEKDSLQGNTVTAKRVASILSEAGISSAIISKGSKENEMESADILIALHARKSAPYIEGFLACNPAGKVILFLTGTDLYEDIPSGCKICQESMKIAHVLVVAQEASLISVAEKYRSKAVVVHQSIQLEKEMMSESDGVIDPGLFTVVGHLRAVKQPFMASEALRLLDDSVRLKLLGKEVDVGNGEVARRWEAEDSRFQWLGDVDHLEALRWMRRSVATINTSLSEGGSNSVGESIVLGVPVLASKVEGNIGILGDDYDGYFSVDSKEELAGLMRRVIEDADFYASLREQVKLRRARFLRENEKQAWVNIIQKIT